MNLARASSLPVALFERWSSAPQRTATLRPVAGGFEAISAGALAQQVREYAAGLMALGLRAGDRVALMAGNGPEWAMLDFAILSIGAVTVPIYPSYGLKETLFILEDSGASLLLLEGKVQLRMLGEPERCGLGKDRIYVRNPQAALEAGLANWDALRVHAPDEERLAGQLSRVHRDQLATLIYTSGTSGWPKGVMLTHGNILSNVEGFLVLVPLYPEDRVLSFLPLSHAFERTTGHFGAYLMGVEVAYAEKPETIVRDLPLARPTILVSVPRLFQVLYSRIMRDIGDRQGLTGRMLRKGLHVGVHGREHGQPDSRWQRMLSGLIGRRVRKQMGGRIRFLVSGGAPLPEEISAFFLGLKLPIVEGYGLTEASPVISLNPPGQIRPGSVGRVLPNLELRVAEDGEILVRGPSVMPAYWRNETATREALVAGWLHTGDVGRVDQHGYLFITDRKKDLIVNSGGENVAPQKIEARLMSHPLINQAVVFGDRRPYLVALIHPNQERLLEQLGAEADAGQISAAIRQAIQWSLKDLPAYEQVRNFHILERPLSQEGGELTPTLKVKRRVLLQHFAACIEALYTQRPG